MADGSLQGYEALRRRIAALSGPDLGRDIMKTLAVAVVRESKLLVHRKTGNLGRSIGVAEVSATSARVVASANYAGDVEKGARAHEIRPRFKKALMFASQQVTTARFGAGATLKFNLSGSLSARSMKRYGNAAYAVVKVVHHPGTKPYPFLRPGAEKAITSAGLADRIVAVWNDAA